MKEKLKEIQEQLICMVHEEMEHPESINAEELGEIIDIIKDIDETIYYCTIVHAMENGGNVIVNTR